MKPDRSQFRDSFRYAGAVASELASPLLHAYGAVRARGPVTNPADWRTGIILGSGHIGDVLYRTCSLDQLASGLPDCKWTYATTPEGAEILAGNPAVSEILPINRETATDFVHARSANDLEVRKFDVALCTDNIKVHETLMLAAKCRIPNRVAFAQKGFSGLATIGVQAARAPWPAQIREMVSCVTGSVDKAPLRPRIYPDSEDRAAARREWDALEIPDATLTIAASVISRQQVGILQPMVFLAVLRALLEQQPSARIVLTGSIDDARELRALASGLGSRAIVRAGTLKLKAFASFLSLCDAFVGVDSGPRHIANAVGIPVFFVRNMGAPEIETGRYCDTETDIAPRGQYLSTDVAMGRIASVNHSAVAAAILKAAARRRSTE